ncbi:hypothetical protein [Adhaeribacter pallidiroseus]|uniref:Uncharacterized protein n=1 Tax=Adhaeribacter pallidiroseus TaxID=2072847 RepID=A0A369QFP5_9BACT|nr:hypothetical protein [Adhaeribacter pallidiroseus]RDC62375.1 hypothetical protein AHMF7616_00968 [Adhaeribacter pallidiroseus]
MKLISLLTFFSFVLQSSAQHLSPKQLLLFRQMPAEVLSKKLMKKGWSFMEDNKPTQETMGKAVVAYHPVEPGNMKKGAEAWCVLYYAPESASRLLYNHFGNVTMQKITKKIRKRGMTLIDKGDELRGVNSLASYADYADQELVFRVMIYELSDQFGIKIFEKEDYLQAKQNNRL